MDGASRPVRSAAASRARRSRPTADRPGRLVEQWGQPPRVRARILPGRGNPEAHAMRLCPPRVDHLCWWSAQPRSSRSLSTRERGMTLIEVFIAVTLFGILSIGILMALRVGL